MQRTPEEEQRISKSKDTIALIFDTISVYTEQCDLAGISRNMIRIADHARALKDQYAITSNEHLDIIDRMDNIITEVSKNCTCRKI